MSTPLKLIVGLGNPGEAYARTRHNAGFWLVDELVRRQNGVFRAEARHQGELARVRLDGQDLWLFKPMQFMNRSGMPLASVASFYRIAPEEILVAHDEIDLPVGTVRLKQGGGHGGHNGLRDAIAHIGDAFWRLRLGVGHPGEKAEVVDYVLMRAPAHEEGLIRDAVAAGADAVALMIGQGAQKAMHRLHSRAVSSGCGA
ncbi:MAG: aminoacyl-tRNA hydrolase [Gammaproteobacteria bacterium]|nr:aminoacyl-tRNA hydrolase [Gammaproteobacteria bacterium]